MFVRCQEAIPHATHTRATAGKLIPYMYMYILYIYLFIYLFICGCCQKAFLHATYARAAAGAIRVHPLTLNVEYILVHSCVPPGNTNNNNGAEQRS